MIVCFFLTTTYDELAIGKDMTNKSTPLTLSYHDSLHSHSHSMTHFTHTLIPCLTALSTAATADAANMMRKYPQFMDVHVMIFVGFGKNP